MEHDTTYLSYYGPQFTNLQNMEVNLMNIFCRLLATSHGFDWSSVVGFCHRKHCNTFEHARKLLLYVP